MSSLGQPFGQKFAVRRFALRNRSGSGRMNLANPFAGERLTYVVSARPGNHLESVVERELSPPASGDSIEPIDTG